MSRLFTLTLILTTFAVPARAGELKKPYFGATRPGSWAKQEMRAKDIGVSEYTYRRLPDAGGRVRLELAMRVVSGVGAGASSSMVHTLSKDFDLAQDGLDYGRFTEALTMQAAPDQPAMETPPEVIKAIREGSIDFKGAFTFKSAETIAGFHCDRYSYVAHSGGDYPTRSEGEMWLSAEAPFAVVKQVGRVIDKDGKEMSSFEIALTDSGSDDDAPARETAVKAEAEPTGPRGPLSLLDAYKAELIRFKVEIAAGSKGQKVEITLENKGDEELTIMVPAGPIDVPAGIPLDTLALSVPAAREVVVPPSGLATPFTTGQRGERGATEGKFTLSMYEGEPSYQGSVTMDALGK